MLIIPMYYSYRILQKAKLENPNIRASVAMSDFFTFDPPENSRLDLVYDYTQKNPTQS